MNFKKNLKKVAVSLAVVVVSVTIGNSTYAAQTGGEYKESAESIDSVFGNSDSIEFKEELLEQYNFTEEQVEILEEERNNFTVNSSISDVFSENQVNLAKLEFQSTHGVDDVFKIISETNEVKVEVNGANGIIRTTTYGSNKEILDVVEVDYFKEMDTIKDDTPCVEAESRATTIVPSNSYGTGTVSSYFTPKIKVTRDTRDRITITSTTSVRTTTYSKDKYNWNSGNTLVFYNAIKDARSAWNRTIASVSAPAIIKVATYLSGYIGATVIVPGVNTIIGGLAALGIVGSVGGNGVIFLNKMLVISNTYKKIA